MSKIIYILPFSKASKAREGLAKHSPFLKMSGFDSWTMKWENEEPCPWRHTGTHVLAWEGPVVSLLLSVHTQVKLDPCPPCAAFACVL